MVISMTNNLNSIRKERNLSLRELALITGVSKSTLQRIESDEYFDIKLSIAFKIARGLGVSLLDIFQDD